jgi:hypothetical protein
VNSVIHLAEELPALLRRGLSPITDNREALLSLGFERAYPQIRAGYESTVWERSVDHGRTSAGDRRLTRERAYLVEERRAGPSHG